MMKDFIKHKDHHVREAHRDGDWDCICGTSNFETRDKCYVCGEPNPNPPRAESPVDFADMLAEAKETNGAANDAAEAGGGDPVETQGQAAATTPGEPSARSALIVDDEDGVDPSYYNDEVPAGVDKTSRELLREHRTKMLLQQVRMCM